MVKTSPSNAWGVGSITGRGAKILHALRPKSQNIKQKQYCNKFNKDFKNGPHQKNFKKIKNKIVSETFFSQERSLQFLTLNILLECSVFFKSAYGLGVNQR